MTRKPNRTGPNRQAAKARARRKTARTQQHTPWDTLPLQLYQELVHVPATTGPPAEHPINAADVSEGAKDLVNTFVRLGPLYRGLVPLAAVYLDEHIRAGRVPLGMGDDPDHCQIVPLTDLAADVAAASSGEPAPSSADEVGAALHNLHAAGWLVVDDNHVVRRSIPPAHAGAQWEIEGLATVEDWNAMTAHGTRPTHPDPGEPDLLVDLADRCDDCGQSLRRPATQGGCGCHIPGAHEPVWEA